MTPEQKERALRKYVELAKHGSILPAANSQNSEALSASGMMKLYESNKEE